MAGRDDKGAPPGLPADARVRIGAQLRRMYDNVVQEPIPDRFTTLLDQLEAGALTPPGGEGREPPAPDNDAAPPANR